MSNLKKRVLSIERYEGNVNYLKLCSNGRNILTSTSYVSLALYAAHLCYFGHAYTCTPDLLCFVEQIINFANNNYKSL